MLKCVKHVNILKKELVIQPNHSDFTKTITSWIFKELLSVTSMNINSTYTVGKIIITMFCLMSYQWLQKIKMTWNGFYLIQLETN